MRERADTLPHAILVDVHDQVEAEIARPAFAKLDHVAQDEAKELFTLFQAWLRRQFTLLGRHEDADALAMHLLGRSQGVATLANAFRDEKFIRREVRQMEEWLKVRVEECEA